MATYVLISAQIFTAFAILRKKHYFDRPIIDLAFVVIAGIGYYLYFSR